MAQAGAGAGAGAGTGATRPAQTQREKCAIILVPLEPEYVRVCVFVESGLYEYSNFQSG